MKPLKEEQELSIGGYIYNEDGTRRSEIEVYTNNPGHMQKFDRYCRENPSEWHVVRVSESDGEICGKTYMMAIGCLNIRPKSVKRNYTNEQRQALANRFKKRTAEQTA